MHMMFQENKFRLLESILMNVASFFSWIITIRIFLKLIPLCAGQTDQIRICEVKIISTKSHNQIHISSKELL